MKDYGSAMMGTSNTSQPQVKIAGYVIGGSLKEGLRVRLTIPSEEIQEGGFVVVESGEWLFYGLVTDVQLGSTDPRFADEQSEMRLPGNLAGLLHGQTLYTNIEVLPTLMLERGPELNDPRYPEWRQSQLSDPAPVPVKTVPQHHASVRLAEAGDVAAIFGNQDKKENFVIGTTREQGHPVCINLEKFVQRSSGIFGATGTGKSFLTRIILAGLIHFDKASVLMFDMHNEYGYDDTASDTGQKVVGLRTKFPSRVRVVGLGRGATIRGQAPDFNLEIAKSDILPGDIEMLARELNLKETTPVTLEALFHQYGRNWLHEFEKMVPGKMEDVEDDNGKIKKIYARDSVEGWAREAGVNEMAAAALHSKLSRVFNRPYVVEKPAADALREIIAMLEKNQHVILSFGDFDSDLDYLLVANLLTRRIRDAWE
ncbi:MAG TPA: ATP-binding protein, partial [Anaerolineaceae bacterium]|nr:ATP-binding protein [Anaerolineaceae bacterium]